MVGRSTIWLCLRQTKLFCRHSTRNTLSKPALGARRARNKGQYLFECRMSGVPHKLVENRL